MTITITAKEYDALQFAITQIETDLEAASDEQYCKDASNCLDALYNINEKYHRARQKANYFQMARAEVSKHNRNLRPRDVDKLTRKFIKHLKETQR